MVFSVHLEEFPKINNITVSKEIVEKMDEIREICNCAASLRKEAGLRLRMPLQKITIYGKTNLDDKYLDLIKQETNVHKIELFNDDLDKIAKKEVILNMKECGKIYGSSLKDILIAQKENKWEIVNDKLHIAGFELDSDLYNIVYRTANGAKTMKCKNFNILVMIDTEITHELMIEGLSRDVVRIIQQARKDNNLNISDNISVIMQTKDQIFDEVLSIWKDYICSQTLATEIKIKDNVNEECSFDIDEHKFSVHIKKIC